MACSSNIQKRTLKQSRIFLLTPDPKNCGLQDSFYGRDCQMMELDNATKNISGTATPYYAWNRYTGELCFVGQTEAVPDIATPTLRFYEMCEPGIPLPWTLGRCMVLVAINHGLCKSSGNLVNGWGQYSEVYGLVPTSVNGGRRVSYNGEDDEISVEVETRQVFAYQIGPISFTQLDLTGTQCQNPVDLKFDDAVFNCNVGCGGVDCGCVQPCDDGAQTFYIPAHCAGSLQNMLIFSLDGGNNVQHALLPAAPTPSVASDTSKAAIANNQIFVMAYQVPAQLYAANLDEYGQPGTWTHVAALVGANGTPTTGTPAALESSGSVVYALVQDTLTGSRLYVQSPNDNAGDGPSFVFPAAADISVMKACGTEVVAGGVDGALYRSTDKGANFALMTGPTGATGDVTALAINDAFIWVGYSDGKKFFTANGGQSWTPVIIPGSATTVHDIHFANSNVGWMTDDDGLWNTWFGGTKANHWTNQAPRFSNFPANFTPFSVATPPCAPDWLQVNTVLMIGQAQGTGDSVAYIGRTNISGI